MELNQYASELNTKTPLGNGKQTRTLSRARSKRNFNLIQKGEITQ